MARVLLFVILLISLSIRISGQCPVINLSSTTGSTCGIQAVTVSGNTFSNSTRITLTDNGAGSVSPASSNKSPFSFTYTPTSADYGKQVTITFITNVSKGSSCPPARVTYVLNAGAIPVAPIPGTITRPTCTILTGSVVLNGLPSTGTWNLTGSPGGITESGTGVSTSVSGLSPGAYSFRVSNSTGCTSASSASVVIPSLPAMPAPPAIGTVTQPVIGLPTGSVVLTGLPATGLWILTQTPGNVIYSGTGTTKTVTGLAPGSYSFSVTNSENCTSTSSANVGIIALAGMDQFVINSPMPACFPSTIDLTNPEITAGSSSDMTFTYWKDAAATDAYQTPKAAAAGIYYIKATSSNGVSSVKQVTVAVYKIPHANAGPDQVLTDFSGTTMNAELVNNYETGEWSVISGKGTFFDSHYAKTEVSGFSPGKNIFKWTVTNGICPPTSDSVTITVNDIILPTLITPDMDGKNDYFVIKGASVKGKINLEIFDRRGVLTYRNDNYNNSWNGADLNGKPLPDDTYFYNIKADNGISLRGFIVIRR